jgi:putative Mg2+ transporter-C (MgtC) family protein
METLLRELTSGLTDADHIIRVIVRLLAATILGSIIGYERERMGKAAGLRTHALVSLGTCIFVVACAGSGMSSDGLSRVIQGIVTGIGFLGAGTILKLSDQRDIKGLTTSAGIWLTAAIGVSVGLGMLGVAIISTIVAIIVLAVIRKWENKIDPEKSRKEKA